MEKNKISWRALFLCWSMLSLVSQAFSQANLLPSAVVISLFILVISLLVVSPVRGFIKRPLEIVVLLLTCHHYFNDKLPFSWGWFTHFIGRLVNVTSASGASEYTYLPENIALVMLLIALLFFCEVMLRYEHWQTPYLFSLCYLVVLMIANESDHYLRFMLVTTLGIAFIYVINDQPNESWQGKIKGLMSVSLIVALSIFAWQLPTVWPAAHEQVVKQGQQLTLSARTSPWYKELVKDNRGSSLNFLGYSDNSEELGGPLQARGGKAFEASSTNPHYWRVSSKEVYTGKGWLDSDEAVEEVVSSPVTISPYSQVEEQVEQIKIKLLDEDVNYLPRPNGNLILTLTDEQIEGREVTYAPIQERFYLTKLPRDKVFNYSFYAPSYTEEELSEAIARMSVADDVYLGLPSTLPERVRDLAVEVTKDEETDYGRLKALESYLRSSSDFSYSLEEAEHLPIDRDFVDHFLFDSKIGYCEHYSTAMVVLARSIGIPARWVKGFSPGINKGVLENGQTLYDVTQNNAHAWVEAYFETIGWVPFEPTKTFGEVAQNQGPLRVIQEETVPSTEQTAFAEETVATEETTATSTMTSETEVAKADQGLLPAGNEKYDKRAYLILLASIAILLSVIFVQRERLSWCLLLLTIKYWPNYRFSASFKQLLKRLEIICKRDSSESLASYHKRLNALEDGWQPSLADLFKTAEQVYYQPHSQTRYAREFFSTYKIVAKISLTYKKSNG